MKDLLEFLHHAEKLKCVLRHSWLSDGRQESTAEHTWRMAIMAMLFAPKLEHKVNLEKAIKIILVHDLVEADVGDVPAFLKDKRAEQKRREKESMKKLEEKYDNEVIKEMCDLWKEYEACSTPEAKFAKALDKLEVHIQHDEADINTWIEAEWPRSQFAADRFCEHDAFLRELNEEVKKEAKEKILKESNRDFDEVLKKAEELRKQEYKQ